MNDKENSQEMALYIYSAYDKEEYLTVGMEKVALLVTGKLHSLSSGAQYASPFLIPWMHTHSHTHKHTHMYI